MEIRVLKPNLEFLGAIDNAESVQFKRRWHKAGSFEIHINVDKENARYLMAKNNLVILDMDVTRVGIVEEFSIDQDDTEELVVVGKELKCLANRRVTYPPDGQAYDKITAAAETVMKHFVDRNMVTADDPDRNMANLTVETDQGRGKEVTKNSRYKPLEEEIQTVSKNSGLGWSIELDINNKNMVFVVKEGKDLTTTQTTNPPVIFANQFDNVGTQSYIDSYSNHKNVAVVGGQGEGTNREIITVGSGSGIDRLETFVDARDLSITSELNDRGEEALAESERQESFDVQILTQGPFKYREDWDLGDIVTIKNDKLDQGKHKRIIEVTETYEGGSPLQLEAKMGDEMATIADKVKEEIKNKTATANEG